MTQVQRAPVMVDVHVTDTRAGFAQGRWECVSINAWQGRPTSECLRIVATRQEELLATHERGIAVASIIDLRGARQTIGPLERQEVEVVARKFAKRTCAHAFIILGGGLLASTARGFVRAVQLISAQHHAARTFSGLDDAPSWIVEHCAAHAIDRERADELRVAFDAVLSASQQLTRVDP